MVCPSPSCMRKQVDELFKHMWHYFDTAVVDDVLTPLLTEKWSGSKKELIEEILRNLAPLLYLEEIKCVDFVEFAPKDRCYAHWEQHAREQGLEQLLDSKDKLIDSLIAGAQFSCETEGSERLYSMHCPDAGIAMSIFLEKREEKEARQYLANKLFTDYMVDLIADVAAAGEYELPLGSVLGFQGRLLQMSRPVSVADVMFNLQLPVLEGIPTADLINIRRDEAPYFLNFRNALRRATEERLKLNSSDSGLTIAEEIQADIIEPQLEKIRANLAAAERSLVKKTSVGIFLGAVGTTCGLLSGILPAMAIGAGVASALGTTGVAASKYLDDQKEVSLNDMYFLWKATEHAH
jgi:hypothetical protein